ncbi:DinB family protein [uncultured Algoriphagus sp.]|uniref:DinB family protein n=1 Tax=uncultured Algoriphagus sp. TaxID=417365 RepID=UPI0030EE5AFE
MKILFIFLCFFAMTSVANAQTATSSLVADWERAKAYTLEYLETMPADKYNLKPTPEMRTFAQQMLHLTDANYSFTSAATGAQSPIGMGESEKSADQSKASVVKQVTAGYDFVIANLKTMTPEKLNENVTLFGRFEMTKGKALEKLFEHQTHHRGQTTVYIRLAGVTPPNEKLF